MKKSSYNFCLNKGNMSYWFNGITHYHFRLDKFLSKKMLNIIDNPEYLKDTSPAFYQKLIEKGFLVDDTINEVNLIREKTNIVRESKYYFLVILPTMNCNFECWYCIQEHIETKMSDLTIQKVKNHIEKIIFEDKIEYLHIEWFGGEPFLYFQDIIKPISSFAKSICEKAGIPFKNTATTNGYFIKPEINSDLINLNFKSFQISLDGTRELHNKVKVSKYGDSAFDVTLKNINSFLSYSEELSVVLRINYTDENLNDEILTQVNNIICKKNRNRVLLLYRRVWQEKTDKTRAKKIYSIIDKFSSNGYCATIKMDLDNGFLPCYADKKYYNAINFDGSVVKCTANDDLKIDPPGKLLDDGSILWKDGFLEKYYKNRFENNKCIRCKYLPICMGSCPRDYRSETDDKFFCKLQGNDRSFEDIIFNTILKDYQ